MAEWFKALVLKTSIRKYRKFESCPFRHFCCHKKLKKTDIGFRASRSMRILSLPPFLLNEKGSMKFIEPLNVLKPYFNKW